MIWQQSINNESKTNDSGKSSKYPSTFGHILFCLLCNKHSTPEPLLNAIMSKLTSNKTEKILHAQQDPVCFILHVTMAEAGS